VTGERSPMGQQIDQALIEEIANRVAVAVEHGVLSREVELAIQARNAFLDVAAHELRTPITNLRGFAQLELFRLREGKIVDPARLDHAFHMIDVHSQKLSRLVSRVLDVVQIDTGRFDLHLERIDVVPLVRRIGELADIRAAASRLRVSTDPVVEAWVDPRHFEQLLVSLIENALRYSAATATIDVDVHAIAGDIRIRVRDYGSGVPVERRAALFDRFNAKEDADKRSGIGLGLYLSRRIVELHGGRIDAEFPEDGGTQVTVLLPRLPRGQASSLVRELA
jgi:signal transduction histidine kinase